MYSNAFKAFKCLRGIYGTPRQSKALQGIQGRSNGIRVYSKARSEHVRATFELAVVGIIALSASGGDTSARADDVEQFVFAGLNGDDWFYFEDTTSSDELQEQCAKPTAQSHFNVRTISGSDTTLINFQYERTPTHKVLHEGRCSFAGLKPVSPSSQSGFDSERLRFRSQEL
jgi:hypothetical protein